MKQWVSIQNESVNTMIWFIFQAKNLNVLVGLRFGLLVEYKQRQNMWVSLWTLGNCDDIFHYFQTFHKQNNRLIDGENNQQIISIMKIIISFTSTNYKRKFLLLSQCMSNNKLMISRFEYFTFLYIPDWPWTLFVTEYLAVLHQYFYFSEGSEYNQLYNLTFACWGAEHLDFNNDLLLCSVLQWPLRQDSAVPQRRRPPATRVKKVDRSHPRPPLTAPPAPHRRPLRRGGDLARPSQLSRSAAWRGPSRGTLTWEHKTRRSSARSSIFLTNR